ncbi:MAG: DNA mismatch repair protein MutT, partial [Bacteroidetes bacterium]
VYLATGLTRGAAAPEHTEDLRLCKMPLEAVFAEVEAGRITDSMTVAATYKLMMLRAQGGP